MKCDKMFSEPAATKLEEMRAERRKKWRITYDCFHAHVKNDKVVCTRFRRLRGNRSAELTLLSVLKGASAKVCKECPDYEDDGEQQQLKELLTKTNS